MGQRASDTRGITCEDVVVPEEDVLLGKGACFKVAMGAFNNTRMLVAASANGINQRPLDESTKYAAERKAFRTATIYHQPVSFHAGRHGDWGGGLQAGLHEVGLDGGTRNTFYASIDQ